MYCAPDKTIKMLQIILDFYELGVENIKKGANIHQIKQLPVVAEINRIKFNIPNDRIDKIDELRDELKKQMNQIEEMFG
jgi:V/A-type H+-transporting ATPase subunit A